MRQRINRGLIGNQRLITASDAGGINTLSDAQQNTGANTWPRGKYIEFKLWGGAGRGAGADQCRGARTGGAGGFLRVSTQSTLSVGQVLYIYVGSGGGNTNVGGGGAGSSGNGGGASYIYLDGVQGSGTLLAVAGAGGGVGGSGGGTTGQSWTGASTNPTGGSQSAGGSGGTGGFGGAGAGGNGGFLSGGSGSNCAGFGGGSGYYGGGGGSGDCGACAGGGGAGGSSYFNTAYFPTALANETGTLRTLGDELSPTTSGGTTDVDYVAGIGSGVAGGAGGNGRVVIIIGSTKYVYSYTSVSPYYYTLTIS